MNCTGLPVLAAMLVTLNVGLNQASAQVVLGQIDDFQDGTVFNWNNGPGAADPVNIATGGPAGAGDRFMQISTTGSSGGAGSHMVVYNRFQWLGNYISEGIGVIEVDLKNPGPQTLPMRLGFRGGVGNGSPGYISTSALILPADNAWHHEVFPIDSAHLSNLGGADVYSNFFKNGIVEFRFLDLTTLTGLPGDLDGSTTFPNPMTLGIDNIHAIAVPEPGSLALLAVGGGVFGIIRRWRRTDRQNGLHNLGC
jgi:PEP-CTERM motif